MKLYKCTVCGYIHEGEDAPDVCPKCGSPKEKFELMSDEDAKKVYDSDRTNVIHMEIINLAMAIADLADEGKEINLDPNCFGVFEKALNEAIVIKQRSKAEIAGHVGKGKCRKILNFEMQLKKLHLFFNDLQNKYKKATCILSNGVYKKN